MKTDKTAWDNLDIRTKAEVIKTAVLNNILDRLDIIDSYNLFSSGGTIHIKPENRGKFTALKKRTGHSSTWFKKHGTPALKKMATFALNARKWKHGFGGNLYLDGGDEAQNNAIKVITNTRNPIDIKYDFIVDTWNSEYNGRPRGYNEELDLYFPYDSPEGGEQTIGPGLKIRPDGKGDLYSFTRSEAKNGVTRELINEKLGNNGILQHDKAVEFLNLKGDRYPYDTLSSYLMRGLTDLRFQVGALGEYNKLREGLLNGDLKTIRREGKTYYKPEGSNKYIPDKRRNDYRDEHFWHFSTGGPIYPFSFNKEVPIVRYDDGGSFLSKLDLFTDKAEPYAAGLGMAGSAAGLVAASTGVGIPVGAAIATIANIPSTAIDIYLAARGWQNVINGNSESTKDALWNTGETALDIAGLNGATKTLKTGLALKKELALRIADELARRLAQRLILRKKGMSDEEIARYLAQKASNAALNTKDVADLKKEADKHRKNMANKPAFIISAIPNTYDIVSSDLEDERLH